METDWGFPHAAAALASVTIAGAFITEWRASRRRRRAAHPESCSTRFRRRQEIAERGLG